MKPICFLGSSFLNFFRTIDSEAVNDLHATANAAVPARFAGLSPAQRFISNLKITSH
jgi:hypothetical protein